MRHVLATLVSATLHGIAGRVVRVEVDVAPGLPGFTIVGLPDAALSEARERVRGALRNAGFHHPPRRITVSLFFLVYFVPAIVALKRRPRHWPLIGLLDLLLAWTVIGWMVSLILALALPRPEPPIVRSSMLSPDGRWWWDGQVWQPMPPGAMPATRR